MKRSFSVKARSGPEWNPTGAGYGLTISSVEDRDRFLNRKWRTVILHLVAGEKRYVAEANIDKDSLWDGTCPHLIKKEIGQWLIECGFVDLEARKWSTGERKPPRFWMLLTENERIFEVKLE